MHFRKSEPAADPTGRLLVASHDARAARRRAVIYVVAHSDGGSLGVVINRTAPNMTLRKLFTANGLAPPARFGIPVHQGGPRNRGRIVTIHERLETGSEHTTHIDDEVSVTPGIAFAARFLSETVGRQCLVAMGHCIWAPGALRREIREGAWVTARAAQEDLFRVPVERRWDVAMADRRTAPRPQTGAYGYS